MLEMVLRTCDVMQAFTYLNKIFLKQMLKLDLKIISRRNYEYRRGFKQMLKTILSLTNVYEHRPEAGIHSRYLFLIKCLSMWHPLLTQQLVQDAECLNTCLSSDYEYRPKCSLLHTHWPRHIIVCFYKIYKPFKFPLYDSETACTQLRTYLTLRTYRR